MLSGVGNFNFRRRRRIRKQYMVRSTFRYNPESKTLEFEHLYILGNLFAHLRDLFKENNSRYSGHSSEDMSLVNFIHTAVLF